MKRPILGWAARAAVAIAAMAWLIRKTAWDEVAAAAGKITAPGVVALLALAVALTQVSCLKWRLFLRARGLEVPLGRLFRLYVIGYFFNTFLPGNMGGDVVRSYSLGRSLRNQADAFGSVFLERYTGFIAMIGLGVAAAALRPEMARTLTMRIFLAGMAALLVGMVAALIWAPLQRLLWRMVERLPDAGVGRKLRRFLQVVFHFRERPGVLLRSMGWSVAFHVLTVVNVWVACRAIAAPAPPFGLAVAVPMALLVSSVPISLNAIGIMEGAFVYFLAAAGLPPAEGMAVALIMRAKALLMALAGGALFALERKSEEAS